MEKMKYEHIETIAPTFKRARTVVIKDLDSWPPVWFTTHFKTEPVNEEKKFTVIFPGNLQQIGCTTRELAIPLISEILTNSLAEFGHPKITDQKVLTYVLKMVYIDFSKLRFKDLRSAFVDHNRGEYQEVGEITPRTLKTALFRRLLKHRLTKIRILRKIALEREAKKEEEKKKFIPAPKREITEYEKRILAETPNDKSRAEIMRAKYGTDHLEPPKEHISNLL